MIRTYLKCVLIVKKSNLKKWIFHQIGKFGILTLNLHRKINVLLHLSMYEDITSQETVETMCLEVYLIWQKKIIENRDKSKITKHLISPICNCQRETIFTFFSKFAQFEVDF